MKLDLNFVGKKVINKHTKIETQIISEKIENESVFYTLSDGTNWRADFLGRYWDFVEPQELK